MNHPFSAVGLTEVQRESLIEQASKLGAAMRDAARHASGFLESLTYSLHRAYAAANYPHGDTSKGFRRWLRDEERELSKATKKGKTK
jgi:hypothetical protein